MRTRVFTGHFETDTGFLRSVCVGETEVLRTIYGAVRDEDWNTIPGRCEVEALRQEADGFELVFTVRCQQGAILYAWRGKITGWGSTLEFQFDGRSESAFRRNRIGLCVLHPPVECVGQPCRTRATDGVWREGAFPTLISPHQPFRDLRALAWRPADRFPAELEFEGDVFETEDQRNWTDASFKTYSTPLDQPFPVAVAPGEEVRQRVRLHVNADAVALSAPTRVAPADARAVAVHVEAGDAVGDFPALGLGLGDDDGPTLTPGECERLRLLELNHLRVDLHFCRPGWPERLRAARQTAAAVGARLQCALFLTDRAEAELDAFQGAVGPSEVDWCLIFREGEKSTSARWHDLAQAVLAPLGYRLATGTDVFFTEINRERPPRDAAVCYSFNPQMHAVDDRSVMETLEAQPDTVASAGKFCAGALILTPITLRPRSNPNATSAEVGPEPADALPATVDPRQRTLFGAAWTAGTLAQLAPLARVASLTFYEAAGWRGVMARETEPEPVGRLFGSRAGELYPVYHVFRALAGVRTVLAARVSDPSRVRVLAGRKADGEFVCLVANVTPDPQPIEFTGPLTEPRLAILEEANLEEWRQGRPPAERRVSPTDGRVKFELGAYAVAVLTGR